MGGMIPAIEAGFPQSEIAAASYRYQREVESGERDHRGGEPLPIGGRSRSSCCRSTKRPGGTRQEKLAALRAAAR